MADNTVNSLATGSLQQLDAGRTREREQTRQNVDNAQTQARDTPAVEVELSQEGRELSLANSQQINAATETEQTQGAAENAASTANLAETEEDQSPPPRESAAQTTRQFDRTANEALGTVIDIRS
ncbi:hypothetical protein HCH_04447 [Hahella chejuensis KCTC 2396]|uniref:Uncharacterized protein n=1 Tax=Hahella chejuensis (strain KCTC 2396) TaxID=349521 RepID=Q2SDX3_HAHCH|nr:hypothetical protein [Hahella chejuensis]ABC31151.1 hypothetical protein HCH_04447 [Hahella chejuensis KCTC 2396]